MAGCNFIVSVFMLLTFFASLVMLSLLSGLCSVWFIVCAFCGLHEGHFYMQTVPLLALVSTMGKSHLVVVAVQGAPWRPSIVVVGSGMREEDGCWTTEQGH